MLNYSVYKISYCWPGSRSVHKSLKQTNRLNKRGKQEITDTFLRGWRHGNGEGQCLKGLPSKSRVVVRSSFPPVFQLRL